MVVNSAPDPSVEALAKFYSPTEQPAIPGAIKTMAVANWALSQETVGDRIKFLHACARYPVSDTFAQAIQNGRYSTWPGLTAKLARKYIKDPEPTVKGHLDQQRINLRSTKPKAFKPSAATTDASKGIYIPLANKRNAATTSTSGANPSRERSSPTKPENS